MSHTSRRPAWHVGPWEGHACSPCDVVSTSLTDLIAPSALGHILVCSSNAPRPLVPGGPFVFAGLSAWSVLSQHSPPPRAAHPSRTRLKCHLLRGAPGASSPLETCCPVHPAPPQSFSASAPNGSLHSTFYGFCFLHLAAHLLSDAGGHGGPV